MSGILSKYKNLRVHKDHDRTTALQETLGRMVKSQLDGIYAGSPFAGHVVMQDSPGEPPCVLETVISTGGDSLSTLYVAQPIFETRAALLAARTELITLINDLTDAPDSGAVVQCPIRNRPVRIKELTLAMLVDIAEVTSKRMLQR